MTAWRLPYTVALETRNSEAIVDRLTEDVVISVTVLDIPVHGRDLAWFLFDILAEELSPPTVTGEIVGDAKAVVLFETSIRGAAAQGVKVIARERGVWEASNPATGTEASQMWRSSMISMR